MPGRGVSSLLLLTAAASGGCTKAAVQTAARSAPRVERLRENPIVIPVMLEGRDGENIDGPSPMRVPPRVEGRLGEYYLYFANHAGTYIRMAYADDVTGPWTVYGPGTLRIKDTVCNDITESSYATYRHVVSGIGAARVAWRDRTTWAGSGRRCPPSLAAER